jgi:hypothetical protein
VRPKLVELRQVQLLDLGPSLRRKLDAQDLAEIHDRLLQNLLPALLLAFGEDASV